MILFDVDGWDFEKMLEAAEDGRISSDEFINYIRDQYEKEDDISVQIVPGAEGKDEPTHVFIPEEMELPSLEIYGSLVYSVDRMDDVGLSKDDVMKMARLYLAAWEWM